MTLPTMPSGYRWFRGGPGLSKAGRAALFASDDTVVWVWDEETGNPVTDMVDESGAAITAPKVSDGWVVGAGLPTAVRVASFSLGKDGKRYEMIPVQTLIDAAASLAPTDSQVAALLGNPASSTRAQGDTVYAPLTVGGKTPVRKDELVINVKDSPYNATGDGSTDDTAAINAAVTAGVGRTVFLPKGTYMVNAVTGGITMNQAGTRLLLDPGATVKVIPNSADNYQACTVTAADCVIEGGTFMGDVGSHTGSTGEWGHLIVGNPGSDRLRVEGVTVTKAWGDGIILQGGASDQSVIDVVADDNRRQGMSITTAVRPRVLGGVYKNTGQTANTAPSAGIDVEPNAGNQVTDFTITGVTFSGNRGNGLLIAAAAGALVTGNVSSCRSVGSTTTDGVYVYAPSDDTIKVTLTDVTTEGNTGGGFTINANKTRLMGCRARSNTLAGMLVQASDCRLIEPISEENGRNGITVATSSVARTRIIGGTTRANGQTATATYINLDNFGTGTTIIGHLSDAGQLTNKPNWGFVVRTGSTARLIGCDTDGTFAAVAVLDQPGNTPMFPKPGSAKQTLPAAATDAATTQTLANSLRTALINLGYGA